MYLVGLCIYIYIYISRHFISSRILLSAGTLFVPRISFYVKILGVFKTKFRGHSVAQFVAELGHKPQGRGFDSLWQIFFSHRRDSSVLIVAPRVDSALTKRSTGNISWEAKTAGA